MRISRSDGAARGKRLHKMPWLVHLEGGGEGEWESYFHTPLCIIFTRHDITMNHDTINNIISIGFIVSSSHHHHHHTDRTDRTIILLAKLEG